MRNLVWTLKIAILMAVATPAVSQAQDAMLPSGNPYSFRSSCASQGIWTQAALDATHKLMKIVDDIKNDGNCTGLKTTLSALAKQSEVGIIQKEASVGSDLDRAGGLPDEIASTRAATSTDPALKSLGLPLLMSKNLENAKINAKLGGNPFQTFLSSHSQQIQAGASNALDLVSAVAGKLPELDRCLMNSQASLQMALGGAINLVSAFSNAGNGFSSKVSQTIYDLASSIAARKNSQVMRKLNVSDLWTSMSCLLESTSEAYCTVRDMKYIFHEGIKDFQTKIVEDKIVDFNNPFQGYYLLVQEVPLVTSWLQKIQIGIEPRLTSDSNFQAGILDTNNDHMKKVKDLQATYNFSIETMRTSTNSSIEEKKVAVFSMLQKLVDVINPALGGDAVGSRSQMNFFTRSKTAEYIPFYLIGMTEIPQGVRGGPSAPGQVNVMEWSDYMQQGGHFATISAFNDPDQLAVIIGANLGKLIDTANGLAIDYYNNWFIVDKPTLINESIGNTQYSVVEVLNHILGYLDHFEDRINKLGGEQRGLLPEIFQTREAIQSVLDAFEAVRNLPAYNPNKESKEDYLVKVSSVYNNVAETISRKFNILQQRAGYISNRMNMFVTNDYTMMIKNNPDLSNYEHEIYVAAGLSIMQRMIQIYSGNPSNVEADFNTALKINKDSLEAIEQFFRDPLYAFMASLKLQTGAKQVTNSDIRWNSYKRMIVDSFIPRHIPGGKWYEYESKPEFAKEHPVRGALMTGVPGFGLLTSWWYPKWFDPDLYPSQSSFAKERKGMETDSHSNEQILARLCTQSLAFENWVFFGNLCENLKLNSPFEETNPGFIETLAKSKYFKGQSLSINGYALEVDYNRKAREGLDYRDPRDKYAGLRLNQANRICAFRDYNRRNQVVWLTMQEIGNRKSRETTMKPGQAYVPRRIDPGVHIAPPAPVVPQAPVNSDPDAASAVKSVKPPGVNNQKSLPTIKPHLNYRATQTTRVKPGLGQ